MTDSQKTTFGCQFSAKICIATNDSEIGSAMYVFFNISDIEFLFIIQYYVNVGCEIPDFSVAN